MLRLGNINLTRPNDILKVKVSDIITEDINLMTIRDAQEQDQSFEKVREYVKNNIFLVKKNGKRKTTFC